MPDIQRKLATSHEIKRYFDTLILDAISQDSGEARIGVSLFLTIAEQYAATIHLVEGGFSTHAPVIIRSMLEALADIINLANDPEYLNQMRFDSARNDVATFDDYAADPEVQEDEDIVDTLTAWVKKARRERDELKAREFKPCRPVDKFKRANLQKLYVAYRIACQFTHNQLTTLRSRHTGKLELRYNAEAPQETIAMLLNIATSVFCSAFGTLPTFTNLSDSEIGAALEFAEDKWPMP